jgi:hypothetical protein
MFSLTKSMVRGKWDDFAKFLVHLRSHQEGLDPIRPPESAATICLP